MSDKRKAKIEELKQKRDALRAGDYDKVEKMDEAKAKSRKPMSMNNVYIDIALMLFCFVTVVGAPIGLFFGLTAIFKYSLIKKQEREQNEEPRD